MCKKVILPVVQKLQTESENMINSANMVIAQVDDSNRSALNVSSATVTNIKNRAVDMHQKTIKSKEHAIGVLRNTENM